MVGRFSMRIFFSMRLLFPVSSLPLLLMLLLMLLAPSSAAAQPAATRSKEEAALLAAPTADLITTEFLAPAVRQAAEELMAQTLRCAQ